MANRYWLGTTSTAYGTAANWSSSSGGSGGASVPTNTDIAIFDSNSSANCVLASTSLNQLRVESGFAHQLITASSVTITIADNGGSDGYIEINKTSSLAFTSGNIATFAFDKGGLDVYDGAGSQITYAAVYVKYGANASVFSDSTSRENCIYSFTDAQEVLLVDGVYPKMVSAGILYAKSITSDVNATAFNTYGSVDILEYRTNGTGTVKSTAHNIYDYDKEFFFESIHSTGIGEFFQFGHTTARFKSGGAHFRLPVLGDVYTNFGNNTTNTFNVQYHKLVIEAGDNASYYCSIQAGHTLDCNELVIRDGGRLYGPAEGHQTPSSKIKCVKRPTIQGDWNFKQIADGIYESIDNIPTLPVTEGGTGLNTLAVGRIPFGNGQLPLQTLTTLNYNTGSSTLNAVNAHFTGKLTVDGLIDPTGMEFSAVGSNPGTDAAKTIWVNSGDSNKLYFGSSEVGGGAVSAVANGANNRVATFSSADALNGEANLTFDGSLLSITGNMSVSGIAYIGDSTITDDGSNLQIKGTNQTQYFANSQYGKHLFYNKDGQSGGSDVEQLRITHEGNLQLANNRTNKDIFMQATAHDVAGRDITISAGDTTAGTTNNIAGGDLILEGGVGKGTGAGGAITFKVANAGSSGSTLNTLATAMTIADDGNVSVSNDLTISGNFSAEDGNVIGNTFIAGYAAGDAILRTYNPADHLKLQTYNAGTSAFTTELEILNDQGGIQITNDLTVSGNFTVSGTTTTLDTANLNVEDKNITLNYNATGDTSGSANGAGITIQDAVDASTDATILWDASNDKFDFSHKVNVAGDFSLTGDAYLLENKRIYFKSADTYIYADTDSSEDLHIGADGHIELEPDNDLLIKAGSTEYVRFDGGNQRVGIGTTSPSYQLDVEGSTNAYAQLSAGDNTSYSALFFGDSDANAVGRVSYLHQDDRMTFFTNGSEKVRITSAGDVGIGDTSPSSKLEVAGTITATGLNLQNGSLDYGGGKQQNGDLAVGWYTFAVVKGRDALGDVSTQRAFGEFLINDVDSSRHGSCRLNATHFFGDGNSIQVFAYNFYRNPVFDELRIKEDTTYSGAALQVYVSNANNNLETYMTMSEQNASWVLLDTWLADSDTSGHDAILGYETHGSSWTNFTAAETIDLSVFSAITQGGIYTTGGMNAEQLFLGKTGTAQTHRLHPDSAGSFIYTNAGGSDVTLAADDDLILHADDTLVFQSGGATKMTLLSSGNLGIGTTTPETELHVDGSIAVAYALAHAGETGQNRLIFTTNTQEFQTAATTRLKIDSNGSLLVGATSMGDTNSLVGIDGKLRVGDIGNTQDGSGRAYLHVDTGLEDPGGTSGNYVRLSTMQMDGGSGGNNVMYSTYALRNATGTDWQSLSIVDGARVDTASEVLKADGVTGSLLRMWHEIDIQGQKRHWGHTNEIGMTYHHTSGGRLGIGTTSPSVTLDVKGDVFIGDSTETTTLSGSGDLTIQGDTALATFKADNGSSGDQIAGIRVFADSYRSAGMIIGDYNNSNGAMTEDWIFGRQYASTNKAGIFAAPENGGDEYITVNSDSQKAVKIAGDNDDIDFIIHGSSGEYFRAEASTGRVGIGTTSPDGPLHIYHTDNTGVPGITIETNGGAAQSDSKLRIKESHGSATWVDFTVNTYGQLEITGGATTRRQIFTADDPDTDDGGIISLNKDHYEWNTQIFGESSTPVIFVDGTNNRMGVGTTSPAAKLEIQQTDGAVHGLKVYRNDSSTSTPLVYLHDDSVYVDNPTLHVKNDRTDQYGYAAVFEGNVGIGDTTPSFPLEIRAASTFNTVNGHIMLTGDSATNGQGPQIVFSESGSGSSFAGAYIGHVRTGSNSTGDLVFATRATGGDATTVPTERMRILSDGKVGIGTTSPAANLHVDRGSVVAPSLTFGASAGQIFQNENSEFAFGLDNDSPYSLWIQGRNSGNAARDISLQPLGGKIGINTEAPVSTLDIGTAGIFTLGNTRTALKLTGSQADLQLSHTTNAHILIDSTADTTDSYFSVRKDSNDASAATELFRVNENGTIKFNNAYDFPNAAGSTGDLLQLDGTNLGFAQQIRLTKPSVFMDTGTQTITTLESTVGFNSEVLDPASNAALTSTDGHIQLGAAGYYRISYTIPINDQGSISAQDRTMVFCFMQTDDNDAFSSPTLVNQSRAQTYTREASGGSGLSTSFIYQHASEDYIRLRIDLEQELNVGFETNTAQISIEYLGA